VKDLVFEAAEYTRADYTALRAWVQRVPLHKIEQLYYSEDAPQLVAGLERHLTKMRRDLIERAIGSNPLLAEKLAKARSGGTITLAALDLLISISESTPARPHPNDPVSKWLRPKLAKAIKHAPAVVTLADLKQHIDRRGPSWWRSIPRIGPLRARAIERWLSAQHSSLYIPHQPTAVQASNMLLADQPLPLERIGRLPNALDGSAGANRSQLFSFIQARNDLEAIHAYLDRYQDQPHTYRSYRTELERLLLWCVLVGRVPLSSMLVDHCEAYKTFLASPHTNMTGPRAGRGSRQWRPFATGLSDKSRLRALRIIRQAFDWLQDVRYLAGNPWHAITLPKPLLQEAQLQADKHIAEDTWEKVRLVLNALVADPDAKQLRLGQAAILFLGDTGLRISEAASAKIQMLQQPRKEGGLWQIKVIGKGNKERTVYFSPRTYEALCAHWTDCPVQPVAVLSPVITLGSHQPGRSFHPNALGAMVCRTLARVAEEDCFSEKEKLHLKSMTSHKLRHTFAMLALDKGVSEAVLQQLLGHSSIQTTGIYARALARRVATEVEKLHATEPV
jgi:site-specific recombinase XerD